MFWTYKDDAGVDVVVQRFEDIPQKYRAKATTLDAAAHDKAKKAGDLVGHVSLPGASAPGSMLGVHVPSFAAGAGAAFIVAALVTLVFKRRAGLIMGVLLVIALGAGYLTWMRQSTGLGDGIATPQAIIDDAKAASDKLKTQMEKQEAALKEIAK